MTAAVPFYASTYVLRSENKNRYKNTKYEKNPLIADYCAIYVYNRFYTAAKKVILILYWNYYQMALC